MVYWSIRYPNGANGISTGYTDIKDVRDQAEALKLNTEGSRGWETQDAESNEETFKQMDGGIVEIKGEGWITKDLKARLDAENAKTKANLASE